MYAADNFHETRTHHFIHSHLQGWHDAPQQMLDDHAELQQLMEDGKAVVAGGARRWADKKIEQQAELLAVKMGAYQSYGDLLTDYLQPAFTKLLRQFATDRQTAGRYAMDDSPSLPMLEEPDDVRAAIVRVHGIIAPYFALRHTWENLRGTPEQENGGHSAPIGDPNGVRSPLAEVRNIDQITPDWKIAGTYNGPNWSWPSNVAHVKLGWLLDNGGHLWLPTKAEQDTVWQQIHQQTRRRAA
jgi:hypothetical protein